MARFPDRATEMADPATKPLDMRRGTARMLVETRYNRRTDADDESMSAEPAGCHEEVGMDQGSKGDGPRAAEDVSQAVHRLRAELTRLGGEIERTANEQFEQRKPELRSSMDDLESAVDSLAARAKTLLGELKAKLDDAGDEVAERVEERRGGGNA